jgi:hypothetical protein
LFHIPPVSILNVNANCLTRRLQSLHFREG